MSKTKQPKQPNEMIFCMDPAEDEKSLYCILDKALKHKSQGKGGENEGLICISILDKNNIPIYFTTAKTIHSNLPGMAVIEIPYESILDKDNPDYISINETYSELYDDVNQIKSFIAGYTHGYLRRNLNTYGPIREEDQKAIVANLNTSFEGFVIKDGMRFSKGEDKNSLISTVIEENKSK